MSRADPPVPTEAELAGGPKAAKALILYEIRLVPDEVNGTLAFHASQRRLLGAVVRASRILFQGPFLDPTGFKAGVPPTTTAGPADKSRRPAFNDVWQAPRPANTVAVRSLTETPRSMSEAPQILTYQ